MQLREIRGGEEAQGRQVKEVFRRLAETDKDKRATKEHVKLI